MIPYTAFEITEGDGNLIWNAHQIPGMFLTIRSLWSGLEVFCETLHGSSTVFNFSSGWQLAVRTNPVYGSNLN